MKQKQRIYYWRNELYVETNDRYFTTIGIGKDGKITIEVDGEYYGPSTYSIYLDVCTLAGFIELWKETYQS